ncbi:lipase/acyltransferase domain-containing protein [Rhizobium sp.]|uniref:lipase/acyltransferase domain-containing protein n=1 Tax=Rhizobium sp. TaxID=391 RepID=UPI003F7FA5A1
MSQFPDLVIFIPGILGSVLVKDGKTVWDLSVIGLYRGTRLTELQLDAPGSLDDDIGDGIAAISVVGNVGGIPGLWKLGGYSRLRDKLIADLGLLLDRNFREFPYDWRRDNRVASSRLSLKSREWLTHWRDVSGNPKAKIWIVAHSMGGLVARHFIECLEGWKIVRSLTTIGTPHRGSGKALDFLNAVSAPGLADRLLPGFDIARNFDSVYQLLPTYPFIVDSSGNYRTYEVSIPGVDQDRAAKAADFHAEIEAGRLRNLKDAVYQASSPRLSVVIGTDQPTYQSAMLAGAGRLAMMTNRDFQGNNGNGDGTVPRVSAMPSGYGEEIATFVCNSHAVIAADKVSLHHLRTYLSGAAINLDAYRDESRAKLGLELEDCYVAGDVLIKAHSSIREQKIGAVIEEITNQVGPRKVTLYRNGEEYLGQIKLQPGFYQATIELLGRSVSDVFWVF